jgi:anti-sigma28 factor (negative regulator of flagellin synthesis)
MKINSDKAAEISALQAQSRASAKAEGGVASQQAGQRSGIAPAASVEIDRAALVALQSQGKVSDAQLLEQIRQKVASGEFQIDYNQVAESLLADAIAASRARFSKP